MHLPDRSHKDRLFDTSCCPCATAIPAVALPAALQPADWVLSDQLQLELRARKFKAKLPLLQGTMLCKLGHEISWALERSHRRWRRSRPKGFQKELRREDKTLPNDLRTAKRVVESIEDDLSEQEMAPCACAVDLRTWRTMC